MVLWRVQNHIHLPGLADYLKWLDLSYTSMLVKRCHLPSWSTMIDYGQTMTVHRLPLYTMIAYGQTMTVHRLPLSTMIAYGQTIAINQPEPLITSHSNHANQPTWTLSYYKSYKSGMPVSQHEPCHITSHSNQACQSANLNLVILQVIQIRHASQPTWTLS